VPNDTSAAEDTGTGTNTTPDPAAETDTDRVTTAPVDTGAPTPTTTTTTAAVKPPPGPQRETVKREWIDQGAGNPRLTVREMGTPALSGNAASVDVTLYSRDQNPPAGSDTLCRRFVGTMAFNRSRGRWTWNHGASHFDVTVINPPSSNCP